MNIAEDKKLLRTLDCVNSADLTNERLRQQIRESSIEIQELESKLRAAYVAKQRAAQIVERAADRVKEVQAEAAFAKFQAQEVDLWKGQVAAEERAKLARQIQIRQTLVQQMNDEASHRAQQKARSRQEEQELLEALERESRLKDEMEMELTKAKKQQFIQELERSIRLQSQWKEIQRLIQQEEERLITEVQKKQQRESAFQTEQKRLRIEQLTRTRERLANAIFLEEKSHKEREDLLLELQTYEGQRKTEELLARQKQLEERRYRKWLSELNSSLKAREVCQQRERAAEEEFRQQLLKEWAIQERLELLGDQQRHRRQAEHRRRAEQLLQEKRLAQAQAAEIERKEEEWRTKIKQTWEEGVFQEKVRILRDNVPLLRDFLPRGLLKDVAEFQRLPEDLKAQFESQSAPIQNNPDLW